MKLVIRIGGSLSIGKDGPKVNYFKKLLPILKGLDRSNQLIVSIGGGKFIRKYYSAIKSLGLTNEQMEWVAIDILKVNVRFLSFLLGKKPIYTLKELTPKSSGVIGGIQPGRSTDANAAYAASVIKADLLIKLTDVDGLYDKDPKKFGNAKLLDRIPFNELKKCLKKYAGSGEPGKYGVLDNLAVETIVKKRVRTVIMNGSNPKDILKAVKGKKIGTLITD